jgi:hypothetical protein
VYRSAWLLTIALFQGTASWMENKQPTHLLSQKAHHRGRRDRMWDSLVRHAPREVSKALDIPMAKVFKLERKAVKSLVHQREAEKLLHQAEKKARVMHAVHRGMLKGQGSMMLAAANSSMADMTPCMGQYKKCEPLAENILEVAKAINQECATLYFEEKAYYKCEADLAEPLCEKADQDFPTMCGADGLGYAGNTGYSVEHGYWSAESPANIHGAFCNGCAQVLIHASLRIPLSLPPPCPLPAFQRVGSAACPPPSTLNPPPPRSQPWPLTRKA